MVWYVTLVHFPPALDFAGPDRVKDPVAGNIAADATGSAAPGGMTGTTASEGTATCQSHQHCLWTSYHSFYTRSLHLSCCLIGHHGLRHLGHLGQLGHLGVHHLSLRHLSQLA